MANNHIAGAQAAGFGYPVMMLAKLFKRLILSLLLLAAGASVASAQTFSIVSVAGNTPNFGALGAASSGNTVYRISPSGSVSVIQGSGGATSGATSGSTVVVRCVGSGNGGNSCNGAQAMLKIAKIGTVTGRAVSLSSFFVQSNDLAVDWVATQADGSMQVRLSGFTNNSNDTVYIGMDMTVSGDNASTSTTATGKWSVNIAEWPNVPSMPGTQGTAVASVRKAISASTTPMSFGLMTKPETGSGTMTINASTGVRTPGGANPPGAISGLTASRGTVAVTGQANTNFSISLPSSFALSNGSTSLTATPTPSQSGTLSLSAGGTYTLGVGAILTVPASATTGVYNGTITATVTYN